MQEKAQYYRFISESKPKRITVRSVTYNDIAHGITAFFNEFFKGAFAFKNEISADRTTTVGVEGVAYFLKILLQRIYNGKMMKILFFTDERDLKISIKWPDKDLLKEKSFAELYKLASDSKFEVEINAGEVLMILRNTPASMIEFHATTEFIMERILVEVFFS